MIVKTITIPEEHLRRLSEITGKDIFSVRKYLMYNCMTVTQLEELSGISQTTIRADIREDGREQKLESCFPFFQDKPVIFIKVNDKLITYIYGKINQTNN